MKLQEHTKQLASLGIPLNERVTLDELLISERVWFFDLVCIEGKGSYAAIVRKLALMAGADDRIEDVHDKVDLDDEEAWVRYRLDGEPRHIDAEIEDDLCDLSVLREVAGDLESGGHRFAYAEKGRALIIVYLRKRALDALSQVTGFRFSWLADS